MITRRSFVKKSAGTTLLFGTGIIVSHAEIPTLTMFVQSGKNCGAMNTSCSKGLFGGVYTCSGIWSPELTDCTVVCLNDGSNTPYSCS